MVEDIQMAADVLKPVYDQTKHKDGYVSIEAAEREYGVRIRYTGEPDRLVRLPQHYVLDGRTDG